MNIWQMLSIDIVGQLCRSSFSEEDMFQVLFYPRGSNICINEDALCQYQCDQMPLSDLTLKMKKIIYLWKAIILDLEQGEFYQHVAPLILNFLNRRHRVYDRMEETWCMDRK